MSSPESGAPRRSGFSEGQALIVGVGSSAGVRGDRPSDIEGEARDLAGALSGRGGYGPSRAHALVGRHASLEALRSDLSGLVGTAQGPADVVLFCFAGAAIKLAGGRRAGVYLLPFDADPSDVPGTALSLEELASFLDKMSAGQAFVLLDLVYPTEFAKNTTELARRRALFGDEDLVPLAKKGSRVIIASRDVERPAGRESLTVLMSQAIEGAARAWRDDGLLRTGNLVRFFWSDAARFKVLPPHVAPAVDAPDFPISHCRRLRSFADTGGGSRGPWIDEQINEDQALGTPFTEPWAPHRPPTRPEKPILQPGSNEAKTPLPAATGTLFPKVSSRPKDFVEPDQEVVFAVELDREAPLGASTALLVAFSEGAASLVLHASISSTSFVPPPGESWSQVFVVARDLSTSPARWEFRARALGDRPGYSLTITFVAAGLVVGAVVVTMPRRNVQGLAPGPDARGQAISLPTKPGAARLVMTISNQPPSYKIRLYIDGNEAGEAVSWTMSTDAYFGQLETSSSVADLLAAGAGLWVDLPASVTSILEQPDLAGEPMLIISDTAVAPFEILRLRPSYGGPLLGLDRPVLRWINDAAMPLERERTVGLIACIRPEYQAPDALPSAAKEEEMLRSRAPSFRHIRRIHELDELLNNPAVRLIHFAGHADGNPAKLALENGSVLPSRFDPSGPLLREGHPFIFLNGCRVGRARDATPSSQANIIKLLLRFRCVGAVAPVIPIHSAAALEAARTFYSAVIDQGRSVGDAMLEVRRLASAPGTAAEHRASLMSYLVFAAPGFRLRFGAAPEAQEDAPPASGGSSPS
jgi:hypothetical protein